MTIWIFKFNGYILKGNLVTWANVRKKEDNKKL